MSGHKHATDRTDWVIVAECVNSDDHLSATLEATAAEPPVEDFQAILPAQCRECGAPISFVSQSEPTEVLD